MDSESEEEVAQEETEATEDDEVTEDAETTEEAEDAVEEAQDEVTEDTGADETTEEVEETTDEAAGRRMLSEKTLNSEPSFEDHFDNGLNYQLWTPEHTMMTGNNEF